MKHIIFRVIRALEVSTLEKQSSEDTRRDIWSAEAKSQGNDDIDRDGAKPSHLNSLTPGFRAASLFLSRKRLVHDTTITCASWKDVPCKAENDMNGRLEAQS